MGLFDFLKKKKTASDNQDNAKLPINSSQNLNQTNQNSQNLPSVPQIPTLNTPNTSQTTQTHTIQANLQLSNQSLNNTSANKTQTQNIINNITNSHTSATDLNPTNISSLNTGGLSSNTSNEQNVKDLQPSANLSTSEKNQPAINQQSVIPINHYIEKNQLFIEKETYTQMLETIEYIKKLSEGLTKTTELRIENEDLENTLSKFIKVVDDLNRTVLQIDKIYFNED